MEAGLKRLWSRKKSLSSTDQPASSRKLSSSNGTRMQSPSAASFAKDGRPSMTSIRQSDRPYAQEKTDRSQYSVELDGEDYDRSVSSHRIQPMLVGISRPGTGNRPDTSGSFQSAVLKAADSVNRRPSQSSTVQPMQGRSPQSIRSPSRHVDIFSVAASKPSSLSRYNEEIAERNIDTLRLALENTPYVYNPSSKYQEEVAIRNAHLPYNPRPSSDAVRNSFDHERTTSMTNRSVRSVTSTSRNGTYAYHTPSDSVASNMRELQNVTSHHVRTLSSRSRDGPSLPTTPKKQLDQDRGAGLNNDTSVPYSPARSVGTHNTREARMSTIQEGLPYDIRPISMTRIVGVRDSSHSSVNIYTEYGAPSVEYNNVRPVADTSSFNDRLHEIQRGEALYGPPATLSVASSTKRTTLPNRTIMDLTNDDTEMFSEASSAFGYSQYSPIVEQAKSDAFRRVEPSQIHTEDRRSPRGPVQSHKPMVSATTVAPPGYHLASRAIYDEYEPEPEYEAGPIPVPATVNTDSEQRLPSPSGFSPISTLASWSPRSSAYVPPSSEAVSMTARVIAALEASRAIAKTPPQSLIPRRETGELVKERVASFESTSDRGTPPLTSAVDAPMSTSQRKVTPQAQTLQPETGEYSTPKTTMVDAGSYEDTELTPKAIPSNEQKIAIAEPVAKKVVQTPVAPAVSEPVREPAAETPLSKGKEKAVATPSVYMSPESITSADYTNPSSTFGVRTRDFAVSPQISATLPAVNQTPVKSLAVTSPAVKTAATNNAASLTSTPSKSGSKKTKKARASKPAMPATTKSVEAGFDEEAFARKRAEARAALEKLQKSLSEDFLTLPDRATVKGKQRLVESSRATPAPVLVLPPEPKATDSGSEIRQRPESMEKPPPSSFRSSREMQQRSSREMSQRSSREMQQRSSREIQQRSSREIQQRSSREMQHRSSLASNRSLSTGSRSSRKGPAPSTLKNVEPAINPINQGILSPALLHAMNISSKPPKSPGEISLSSFPVPSSSRPPSQPDAPPGLHSHNNSITSVMKRRSSTKSQASIASAFSIPLHMVPGRTSSVRDPVPEEVDTWG